MKKYSAMQMIGEMAKGGGAYFGQIAVEKLRAERLAHPRRPATALGAGRVP